jgi:hypothetical protein
LQIANRPIIKPQKETKSAKKGKDKKWFDKIEVPTPVNPLAAPPGIVYSEHIEAPFNAITSFLNEKAG